MAKRRTVTVDFTADTAGAITGFRSVSREAGATGSGFTRFGKTAAIALGTVATGAVVGLGRELANRGVQIESIMSRAETVFGSGADAAKKWADENNEAFGTSEASLLNMANGLQDLLVPLGFARAEAQKMTTDSLDVANALSEWTGGAKSATDAADAISKALLGERERLKEFGVKLSEADIKTRLAAQGMDKLTGAALEQAKAQVSLELIMEKSTDAITAYNGEGNKALRDQKELAAQVADLKDEAALLATKVSAVLVPAMSNLIGEFNKAETASKAFKAALDEGATAGEAMLATVAATGDLAEFESILAKTGVTTDDLTKAIEGGTVEIDALAKSMMEGARAAGLSDVEATLLLGSIDQLADALVVMEAEQVAATEAMRLAGDEAGRLEQMERTLADTTRAGAAATRDHSAARLEQASPLLAAWGALDRLRDSQAEVNQLEREGKTATEEYDDAVRAVLDSQLKLNAALAAVPDDAAGVAADLARQAGINADALKRQNDELDRYNNWTPASKTINIRILQNGSTSDVLDALIRNGAQNGNIGL